MELPITETTKWVDFDSICTIVLNEYRPVLAKMITERDVIWTKIIQSRKADGTLRCGTDIVEPILTGLNV